MAESGAQSARQLEGRIDALADEALMDRLEKIDPSTPEGAEQLRALERDVAIAEEGPAGQSVREPEPGLSDRETPGGPQPKRFERGNFAHENAEALRDVASPKPGDIPPKFSAQVASGDIIALDQMPSGLKAEVEIGVTARPDRIGGIIYEIKPNTEGSIEAGLARVQEYVRLANASKFQGRSDWTGKVVVYDAAAVRNLVP